MYGSDRRYSNAFVLTTVAAASGRQITTIESLVEQQPDLIEAWVEENVHNAAIVNRVN